MNGNPWYDKVNNGNAMMPAQQQPNMFNVMGQISQAMQNPQAFAMQAFSDVPPQMWNNPEQALQHIMQTRGLTQADVQNMINSLPFPR